MARRFHLQSDGRDPLVLTLMLWGGLTLGFLLAVLILVSLIVLCVRYIF